MAYAFGLSFLNFFKSLTMGSNDSFLFRSGTHVVIIVFNCPAPGIRDSDSSAKMLTGCRFNHAFLTTNGILLPSQFLPSCI